jgi:uncharacterized membrane protein YvbJ
MPYCHKCGLEVKDENSFCPHCGANLKAAAPKYPRPVEPYRSEKGEKDEKNEKGEKQEKMEKGEQQEKYEKQQYGVIGPLVGGVIMIFVGFMFYLAVTGAINFSSIFPFFLIILGGIIIIGVAIGAMMARGRNPKPEN